MRDVHASAGKRRLFAGFYRGFRPCGQHAPAALSAVTLCRSSQSKNAALCSVVACFGVMDSALSAQKEDHQSRMVLVGVPVVFARLSIHCEFPCDCDSQWFCCSLSLVKFAINRPTSAAKALRSAPVNSLRKREKHRLSASADLRWHCPHADAGETGFDQIGTTVPILPPRGRGRNLLGVSRFQTEVIAPTRTREKPYRLSR